MLRSRKADFESEVAELRAGVKEFAETVKQDLQVAMDKNRQSLVEALLPLVSQNTPAQWCKSDGASPDDETLSIFLDDDLRKAFGTADRLIRQMEVKLVFKGVTYELLTDDQFIEAARQAIPELGALYDEFDAARAVTESAEV